MSIACANGGVSISFIANATFNGITGTRDVSSAVTWIISNTAVISSISPNGTGPATGVINANVDGQSTSVSASLCNVQSNSVTVTATSN